MCNNQEFGDKIEVGDRMRITRAAEDKLEIGTNRVEMKVCIVLIYFETKFILDNLLQRISV